MKLFIIMQKSHENVALASKQDFAQPRYEISDSYENLVRRIKEMERNLTIRVGVITLVSAVYFYLLDFLYRT